ncbi:LOW QUALITY PROTEIN: histone-lysine n-methyltransferase setmar-like protein [Elysia marginata]|uniref:Histone-lysine n-methyltransferase setmar-like protein n=1 Tax=Elysia marginata TaxID=1093978 RepID=A0AAV4JJE5_9GAST|nr:LOW QUALITY PROTEIN: histone-lysine n-methyltransferase setmar-like protein [Elysia marginata]
MIMKGYDDADGDDDNDGDDYVVVDDDDDEDDDYEDDDDDDDDDGYYDYNDHDDDDDDNYDVDDDYEGMMMMMMMMMIIMTIMIMTMAGMTTMVIMIMMIMMITKLILIDKQKDIAKELEILKEKVQHIITDILGYRKVSARWVPRILTDEMKMQRKTTCAELLKRYEEEGEEFIQQIVTGDESWVHHYDPESKRQSMEYRHKSSPSPRKFKVVASARKMMLTVF